MRAVIISGGRISGFGYIKEKILQFGADLIICADSGYNHALAMGLSVDLIAGDFDSLEAVPENIKAFHAPCEKDFTDTELALSEARKAGAREFLFAGATGTRTDHMLTNIFILKNCLRRGERAEIIDEHNKIRITETSLEIKGTEGTIISLVPLCDCTGVTTTGLKYPLENAELKFGSGHGVSNIITSEKASVSLGNGTLLVIEARD
jgi:thiamine pyrophosphokinase